MKTRTVYDWSVDWCRARDLKMFAREEIGSTNQIAKDDLEAATQPILLSGLKSSPSLYLARTQTAGRGRGDHVWTTPEHGALLSSWSFAIQRVPQPVFSALVGLAVFEAASETWPTIAFNLKAPNDLYIDRKKVAGLLIETVDSGRDKRTVIGFGLNVLAKPPGVEIATCLADHNEISESDFARFLDAWRARLETALLAGFESRLSADVCARLGGALNRHPLLKEPITRVDELGQLHSPSRVIHWHEL